MTKKAKFTAYLSPITKKKLADLSEQKGISKSAIAVLAIDKYWKEEVAKNAKK